MEGLTVLSLFDGMSCARISLIQSNIPVKVYYASEIDKHAIKQTQLNFPNTVQIGDVTNWGDGVTAEDVLAMCEVAYGEAEI